MSNQSKALAILRMRTKLDPELYEVRQIAGQTCVRLSIGGHEDWYVPRVENNMLVGIRSIALPQPEPCETPEDTYRLDYMLKKVNRQQAAKIMTVLLIG